jgi:DNA polymerase III, beta subunit
MKFFVERVALANLLTKLQTVISPKATLPILSNLLVEAKGKEVFITATDLTVGMKVTLEAKVKVEGRTTLPARKLTQLIKELTVSSLEFSTNGSHLTEITAGSSTFRLHGMSPDEFPALPDFDSATKLTLSQKEFKQALDRTSFAVSKEDSRYALSGVLMQIENGLASFVATDGKRLSKNHVKVQGENPSGHFIIPIKAIDEVSRSLEEGSLTLHILSDKIAFELPSCWLITRLLAGEFPDYMRIIPKQANLKFSLHREELMSLLRQISLFTLEINQSVRFSFDNRFLQLSANAMDVGEGQVSMPVDTSGEKLDIAFNPGYFLDILRHSNEETVTLGLSDAFNPGILYEGKENFDSKVDDLFVLMPMRLEL